jgi:hypothetical protein
MSSPLKTCWANPWVRRPLLVALALALVFGACWIIIDRLGRDAWKSFEKQLAAEGETVDFRALLSPPVPEAENFCAIPPLRNLALPDEDQSAAGQEGKANRARIEAMRLSSDLAAVRSLHGIQRGTPLDFAKLAEAMRKEGSWPLPPAPGEPMRDVQAGLAKYDPFCAELAAGLARPRAQWTPCSSERKLQRPYVMSSLHQIGPGFTLAKILTLRAAVAGTAGDLPKAIESLRIAKRLAIASFDEPLLIEGLVGSAIESLSVNALWEICRSQQGTAEDWLELEKLTTAYEARGAFLRTFRGEMAASVDTVLYAKETRQRQILLVLQPGMHGLTPDLGASERAVLVGLNVAPPGFFDSVASEFGRTQLRSIVRPLRDESWAEALRSGRALEAKLNAPSHTWNLPSMFGRDSLGTFARTLTNSVYFQVLLDQAAIACVLERTRLSAGSYPASLDGLTLADGRLLPPDACTGQPMHYRQTTDGRYVLWSVGSDGRDDNASRGASSVQPMAADYVGDWVWGYSATP